MKPKPKQTNNKLVKQNAEKKNAEGKQNKV